MSDSSPTQPTHPPQTHPPHDLGAWGEAVAAQRMTAAGWTILERNLRLGRREIDLVARRSGVLAFVEVKTRAGRGYGPPEEAVTWKKRREIEAVALSYLSRLNVVEVDVRFDVVAIVTDGRRSIRSYRHIEDAWRPEPPG